MKIEDFKTEGNLKQNSLKESASHTRISHSLLMKQLLKEVLYNSIAQAILKIIWSPNKVIKVFLTASVLVSSGLSGFLVIQSILSYFKYEVITMTRTIYEMPTLYPKVTICMTSKYMSKNALDFLREINHQVEPTVDVFDSQTFNKLSYDNKTNILNKISEEANYQLLNLTDDKKRSLSHSLKDILLYCQFNGQTCSPDDFIWKFDNYLGNCYVFNSGYNSSGERIELKQSYIAGALYGLYMDLYVNFYENLTVYNSYIGSTGVYIKFENSSYLSDDSIDTGVYLESGLYTYCSLQRKFTYNLAKPYSNCEVDSCSIRDSDSELLRMIARSPYAYSQQMCLYQCIQKDLITNCNCTYANYLNLFKDHHFCQTAHENDCMSKYMSEFTSNSTIKNDCLLQCPLECNFSEYSATVSSYVLLADSYTDMISKNVNLREDFVQKPINSQSIVGISAFYKSLSYTYSNEYPRMDLVSLFAFMGGNLSLFLGISLFSIFEIVELLIEIFYLQK